MTGTATGRVRLFRGAQLLGTVFGLQGRPEPYYTLDDGAVVRSITYVTMDVGDGTVGFDVQVVPVGTVRGQS